MTVKKRVHQILEGFEEGDRAAQAVKVIIALLIVISIICVILESVESINGRYEAVFLGLETVIVGIFSIEYALRIWSCTEDQRYRRPVIGRIRYALTIFAIFDVLAILPFYLPMVLLMDARFLRAFRLIRLFRVAKMARYSNSVAMVARVVRREKETIIVTFGVIILLMIFASCIMWQVEHEAQPDKFSNIPETMWWAVVTLTTVGYGDIVPITPLGKILGAAIAVLGIGVIAGPTGIVVSGFIEEAHNEKESKKAEGSSSNEVRIALLERLTVLKEKGAITDQEFLREKERLLGRP